MNRLALPVALCIVWLAPAAALAGDAPGKPVPRAVAKKVWTTEDVEMLRDRGLISLIGIQPAQGLAEEALPATATTPRPVRAKDPDWYAEQVAEMRAAIVPIDAEVQFVHRELSNARYWEGGVSLVRENPGITPDSGLWVLDGRKSEPLSRIDVLVDQARRNGVPPSAVR